MSQPNPIQYEEPCPSCSLLLNVTEERLFTLVKCPTCSSVFRLKTKFGNYEFLDVLGRGGCGRVLKARLLDTNEEIALKVLERSHLDYNESLHFLHNEAEFAKIVKDQSIVRVLRLEEDERGARLEMELMRGGSLHDLICSGGKIDEKELLKIGFQIGHALSVAFDKGIIHRDIKPANILFNQAREAKLADFGLARSITPGSTVTPIEIEPHIMATPDYVSVEILAGHAGDFRSDIYALGGSLYHGVTGRPPFVTDGLLAAELISIKQNFPPMSSTTEDLHSATTALINRMLDPDPQRRFSSYNELKIAFEVALNHLERVKVKAAKPQKQERDLIKGFFSKFQKKKSKTGLIRS